MAPPPESDPMPPVDTVAQSLPTLTVRANRRRHLLLALIGLPLVIASVILTPTPTDLLDQFLYGLLIGIPGGMVGGSTAALFQQDYLIFDSETRTLLGPSFRRRWTTYPRKGFSEVEYSVYDGRIYEVRGDGKRRRLIIHRRFANPQDWKALVDLLLDEQPKREVKAEG